MAVTITGIEGTSVFNFGKLLSVASAVAGTTIVGTAIDSGLQPIRLTGTSTKKATSDIHRFMVIIIFGYGV